MKIELTNHAHIRMTERRITIAQIRQCFEKGIPSTPKPGIFAKEHTSLRIVYREIPNGIKLITACYTDASLSDLVDKIPHPHEWWKLENRDAFVAQAKFLEEKGLSTEDIIDHLTNVYKAVCGEFGE